MFGWSASFACFAALLAVAACAEPEPGDMIVGSWIIDANAQRDEVAKVSPSELEDFDEAFRANFLPIRETFHPDGRYEVVNTMGGPFADRWEIVSQGEDSVTIRSSGHSWIARQASLGSRASSRSPAVLTYTFSDADHMRVTIDMPVFGEKKTVSYFFVRED